MVSKVYRVIGSHDCHFCGREIPTRQSENGTINLSCWHCGVTGHAKGGTEAHAATLRRCRRKQEEGPAPEVAPDPIKQPAQKKAPAFGMFNIGG